MLKPEAATGGAPLKIVILKNFAQACNFIKKRLQHRCFPVKFAKFPRIFILKNS